MHTINIIACGLQFLLFVFSPTCALQCLECDHVPQAHDCQQLTTCSSNERCFVQRFIGTNLKQYYKLGCTADNVCRQQDLTIMGKRSAPPQSQPLDKVSRDREINSRDLSERQASGDMVLCLQCCNDADGCNKDLCGSPPTNNLRCLSCNDVMDPTDCDHVQECDRNKYCYVQKGLNQNIATYEIRHQMGCLSELQCTAFQRIYKQNCVVCCNHTDYCNYGACDHFQPQIEVTNQTTTALETTTIHVPTHPTTTTTTQPTTTMAPSVTINAPLLGDFNANINLTCITIPAAQSYEWKMNKSSPLPPGVSPATHSSVAGAAGINMLTISHLNESTMGEYTCIATTNGHVIQATHFIDIKPAPPTVSIEKAISSKAFTLQCIVGGYPRPAIVWDFQPSAIGAQRLPPGLEFSDNGREAVIYVGNYRQTDHDGDWSCKATNSHGTAIGKTTIP